MHLLFVMCLRVYVCVGVSVCGSGSGVCLWVFLMGSSAWNSLNLCLSLSPRSPVSLSSVALSPFSFSEFSLLLFFPTRCCWWVVVGWRGVGRRF
ncbi:hypothetical protein DFJ73DRAFT_825513 [Zopfochytrium polystomum]|nr:hypothetical protein DFJ73DRAFT_825513 [Zopfochytrium polystomum]